MTTPSMHGATHSGINRVQESFKSKSAAIRAIVLARLARWRRRQPDLVVFVADHPRGREAKIASSLRASGWRVVLLHAMDANYDLSDFFDETHRYTSCWQALLLSSLFAPQVYHVFSIWADRTAQMMIQHKPGIVCYDFYDAVELLHLDHAHALRPVQRFCIENADALCCRDLQAQGLQHFCQYKLPRRVILFPEYCWDEPPAPIAPPRPRSRGKSEIHIVLIGYFGVEKQGYAAHGYLKIAGLLTSQGIHFHIYPHPSLAGQRHDVLSDYVALEQNTPYFHLHEPVPLQDVISELRNYDIGISIIHALTYGDAFNEYNPAHFHYCGSSRLFDYLDAGLPVIMNRGLAYQFFLLDRFGVALDATPEMLESARERLRIWLDSGVRERAVRARESLAVRRHIHRLISFYKSL